MNKNAHSNPKSLSWIISLVVIIVLSGAIIFGSKVVYDNTKHTSSSVSVAVDDESEAENGGADASQSADVQAGASPQA